jgi:hypothetical protein
LDGAALNWVAVPGGRALARLIENEVDFREREPGPLDIEIDQTLKLDSPSRLRLDLVVAHN